MRRVIPVGACALSLLLAQTAAAHVEFTPTTAHPNQTVRLVINSPNEGTTAPIVALELVVPKAVIVDDPEAKPGWRTTLQGNRVEWRGGSIPPGQFATFMLDVTAPSATGEERFTGRQYFADGKTEEFHPVLTVEPPAPASRAGTDSSARSLARAALFLAIAAVALAVGAGFLGLWLWLRPPPRDAA